MASSGTSRFVGFLAGVAVAMTGLQAWSYRFESTVAASAAPRVLRAFVESPSMDVPKSSQDFPAPWFATRGSRPIDGWMVRDEEGQGISPASMRSKVVVLSSFCIACSPCRAQIAGLQRLRDSLKNEPVVFLLVTKDAPELAKSFVKKNNLSIPVYWIQGEMPEILRGTPATLIQDPQGEIVYREEGALNWDTDAARSFIRGIERH